MNKDFTVVNASSIKLRVCGGLTDGTCIAGTGTYNIFLTNCIYYNYRINLNFFHQLLFLYRNM